MNCRRSRARDAEILTQYLQGTAWYIVYSTVLFELEGKIRDWVSGKDILFTLLTNMGEFVNHNLEFNGGAIEEMGLDDRHTLATMCTE